MIINSKTKIEETYKFYEFDYSKTTFEIQELYLNNIRSYKRSYESVHVCEPIYDPKTLEKIANKWTLRIERNPQSKYYDFTENIDFEIKCNKSKIKVFILLHNIIESRTSKRHYFENTFERAINDYKNECYYPLSVYKNEIDQYRIEYFNQIKFENNINSKTDKTLCKTNNFEERFSSRFVFGMGQIFRNIEIVKHCTKILNELQGNTELPTAKTETPTPKKLKWTGTAAQFGYIMQELIGKGYIEKPTGSFPKDAEIYLEHFEIDGKKSTLIKELSETQNSIANTNRALLKIASKEKLK